MGASGAQNLGAGKNQKMSLPKEIDRVAKPFTKSALTAPSGQVEALAMFDADVVDTEVLATDVPDSHGVDGSES